MKKSFLLFAILFSLNLSAQIRTTVSGPDKDKKEEVITIDSRVESGLHLSPPATTTQERFDHLSLVLHRSDKVCGSHTNLTRYEGAMLSYYKLSFYKYRIVQTEICAEERSYFECMNNRPLSRAIKDVLNDKESSKYLQKTYDIDSESADKVMEFYKSMSEFKP